ncbi:MAG: SDR family oxidoreductase [Actinomycetia bacterium]|nr:SDR family oxidoreductase [Actinomycetes bacterium]
MSAPSPRGLLDFAGRTVVITGAASGMGAETTKLLIAAGATIHTIDLAPVEAPVAATHQCDLGDPSSIDVTVANLPGRIDALMNCAGVPNGGRFTPEEVMGINWLGLRHLTEALLPRISAEGSVVHIASTAGRAWPERQTEMNELMAAESFDKGLAWVRSHSDVVGDGYQFSKEAVQYYTHWRSVQLLRREIRMNSVCPGITDTGIIADFRKGMGDDLIDHAEAVAGRLARPGEMAPAMLFLADHASSSYLVGVNLNIDHGTAAARLSGQDNPTIIYG